MCLLWLTLRVQLRELKQEGLTYEEIASRMDRSVHSVHGRWRTIADESEKQKRVQFSKAEDRLVR